MRLAARRLPVSASGALGLWCVVEIVAYGAAVRARDIPGPQPG
jgi:hypothetical protein